MYAQRLARCLEMERVAPLGWLMFVELPAQEAYAPLYAALKRLGFVLLAALFIAALAGMFLAGRVVGPIQALRTGAARLGSGDLSQRIAVNKPSPISLTPWRASCRNPMPAWRRR